VSTQPQHIFAIASILPNKYDAYEGDFILRHAQAVALLHPVTLVYCIDLPDEQRSESEHEVQGKLQIYRIYLKQKLIKPLRIKAYAHAIDELFCKLGGKATFTVVHAHIHWRAGYAAYKLQRKYHIPYCLTEHLGYFNEIIYQKQSVPQYRAAKKLYTKRILRNAAVCMPVSQYLSKLIKSFEPHTQCQVVANVVNTHVFKYTTTAKPLVFTLLHMSNASVPQKNIVRMLQGMALAKDAGAVFKALLYVPQLPYVLESIAQYGLQDVVQIKPYVSYEAVAEIMQNVHCLVVYSIEETFSCVTAESLCCGTPVIGISVTGTAELINDTNGIKADPFKPQELADAIVSMQEQYDHYDLHSISKEASNLYCYAAIAEAINKVYGEVTTSQK
jgi:glycosyltransferase involved in cell wall biosynthesis